MKKIQRAPCRHCQFPPIEREEEDGLSIMCVCGSVPLYHMQIHVTAAKTKIQSDSLTKLYVRLPICSHI